MKDEGGRMKTINGAPTVRLFSSFILPPSSLQKKTLHLRNLARALHRRQAAPDALAVGFIHQARITDHQHAAIGFIAYQAPRALL